MKPPAAPPPVLAAILLAVLMAAFIVYGSLYPFRFRPLPAGVSLGELVRDASMIRRPSRGDLAANLLLYAPLALALSLALASRLRPLAAAGLAALACFLLSVAMETGQFFVPPRTPSAWDMVLNSLGGAAGALAGAVLAPHHARGALAWRPRIVEAFPAILVGCWVVYRLYPYVPALDLGEWKASVKPLLRAWEPDLPRLLRLTVFWVVAGRLLDAARPRGEGGLVLAGAMLLTLGAAIPLVGRWLTWEEIVAAGLAWPIWLLLRGRRWTDPLLFAALLAAVLLEGLRPYAFLAEPRPFSWRAGRSLMTGHAGNGLQAMLFKVFQYGGLAWLGLRAGLRLWVAAPFVVAVAFWISWMQTWLPGRSAEITDAVIAAAAVGALWLLWRARAEAGSPTRPEAAR
jgi:VanZ family protein